jgi:hypothetical protein
MTHPSGNRFRADKRRTATDDRDLAFGAALAGVVLAGIAAAVLALAGALTGGL